MSIRRTLLVLSVAAVLVSGAVACSSDDADEASTTTAAETAQSTAADDGGDTSSDESTSEESASDGEADCEADREAGSEQQTLSGVGSVLFAADVDSGVSEADITAETTMTVGADGQLSPSTLTIGVGEVFGVAGAEDGGLGSIVVGCAGGQTLVPGAPIGFVITEPGSYDIVDDMTTTTIGSVSAE